jgi:hypothetical protein
LEVAELSFKGMIGATHRRRWEDDLETEQAVIAYLEVDHDDLFYYRIQCDETM